MAASRFIDLSRTRIADPSVLFSNKALEHPAGLKLSGIRLGGRPVFPFRRGWCPLQELDLSHTDANDQTLAALPEGLVNLFKLDLTGTDVSDAGLEHLSRLDGLTTLNLAGTRVTSEGVARWKARWRGRGTLTVLTAPASLGSPPNRPRTSVRGTYGRSQ